MSGKVTALSKIAVLVYLAFECGHCQDFGYEGDNGPTHWGEKYDQCIGKHQSPIDIEEDNIRIVKFPPLKFENFDKHLEVVKLENNGHTVLLSIKQGRTPRIRGGPLKGIYLFSQLHFHWGNNDTEGSENMINNHSFPLELHMVFYKKVYEEFQNAVNYPDGLAVLSFLYSLDDEGNQHYEQLENGLGNVHNTTSVTEIIDFVSLDKLTTTDKNLYFTYEGSLTTPPCSEVVTWIEFKNTIPLSHDQIEAFRLLDGHNGQHMTHNFRPTQPLNDRIIYMNAGAKINFKFLFIVIVPIFRIINL